MKLSKYENHTDVAVVIAAIAANSLLEDACGRRSACTCVDTPGPPHSLGHSTSGPSWTQEVTQTAESGEESTAAPVHPGPLSSCWATGFSKWWSFKRQIEFAVPQPTSTIVS